MTGGMRMSGYDDGYSATPAELDRIEQLHSRLEALSKAKAHIAHAHEWLEMEGVMLHGTLPDMMNQISLMSEIIHQDIIHGEE